MRCEPGHVLQQPLVSERIAWQEGADARAKLIKVLRQRLTVADRGEADDAALSLRVRGASLVHTNLPRTQHTQRNAWDR